MLCIAFGTIQPEMLDAIREVVNLRAKICGEALASPQGDSMRSVSERTRTRRWNKPLPEVKGPTATNPEAYEARTMARLTEEDFTQQENEWWEQYARGQMARTDTY